MDFSHNLGVQAFWSTVRSFIAFAGYRLVSDSGLRVSGIGIRVTNFVVHGLVKHVRSSKTESISFHVA